MCFYLLIEGYNSGQRTQSDTGVINKTIESVIIGEKSDDQSSNLLGVRQKLIKTDD